MPSIMPRTVYPALSAPQEGNDREYQEYEKQYFRDASRASGNSAEAENRGHDGDNEKDHCVVKHFYLPPPAIFALALCGGIFLSGLSGRNRRLPRFPVGRVRRAHTADMSPPFISRHPILCCDGPT
jgi:hypothetical protein